jgi:biopolymer transport protein ExbD/biopolymer transport protein TolR
MLQNKTNKQVFFRADARAHYGTVMDAIDAVRTTGVEQVGLLTEQRQGAENHQPPPPAAGGE